MANTNEISAKVAVQLTIALIATQDNDDAVVGDSEISEIRKLHADGFIDNDDFMNYFDENVWTDEDGDCYAYIHNDGQGGYFLSDESVEESV